MLPGTPTPSQPRNSGQGGRRGQRGLAARPRGDGSSQGSRRRSSLGSQYCTQKCLLGLVGGGLLDERCPNAALHRGESDGVRHPVDHAEWLRLLREQLRRTLDGGVVCIGKQGAQEVVFQVTLLAHGYTFVGKGTVPVFVEDLEHEAAIYHRLQPLQGVCVPVFLGAIDLRDISRVYYYDFRVRIVYMMFPSWAGDSLDEAGALDAIGGNPEREVVRSVRGLHAMGVVHTDVRMPNTPWSRETRRVMMIDFERAVLMDLPRLPLAETVSNKRARVLQGTESGKAVGQLGSKSDYDRPVWNDIMAAKSVFQS